MCASHMGKGSIQAYIQDQDTDGSGRAFVPGDGFHRIEVLNGE